MMHKLRTQACLGLMSTFRRQLAIQYRRNEFKQRQDDEHPTVLPETKKRNKPTSSR
jgi:hypothetical protein